MSEENNLDGNEIQVDVLPTDTGDRVTPVDIQAEMQRSYLDYAMAVIIGRALPDVRDGLKPVHRRIIYAMYDGGYLPNRSFSKSSRVVGEVMGLYHPHGDTAIYDTLVRLVQEWTLRYPLALGQGNFGSPGNEMAAAQRYTEIKMAPLALEMVRDIREGTVDFQDNYDGRNQEPTILPARFPNLLVNGSSGIAVGMATNIPPHNLVEIAAAVQWYLKNPEVGKEEILETALKYIEGPDFPTGATIIGRKGIEDVYRTGHGSITQRAVVDVEEIQGRTCLVATELPYQVNPDNLAIKIADLVKDGRITGIADIRDETSGRTGQRLVIVLKKEAVAKVVLNNLYKLTQLQENFSANMLAIVDGVPRTLSLDVFLRYWLEHQVEVIVRRTRFRLQKAEEEIHILRGLLKALEALDEVIRRIRSSQTMEEARQELINFLGIDRLQANAILDMQLRRLAALERQKIIDQHDAIAVKIEEYTAILASEARQREIIGEELQEIVDKFGDERRTKIIEGLDANAKIEDLIAEEEMVVTITRGGYVKRTRSDNYRSQARGGKGIRGAQLRGDDVVQHFFVTTTHHWLLFFTNLGRVYRIKAYELLEAGRGAKGQHIANLLPFLPNEKVAQVLDIKDYKQEPYLVLATRNGLVKKSRLEDYDSNRSGGVIAINLRNSDELVSAALVKETDDLLLVSRKGRSIRFSATDTALRPLARATSGVTGMKFRGEDKLLAMDVIKSVESPDKDNDEYNSYVFIVTGGGYAKRSPVSEYRVQERGGLGVRIAKLTRERGDLVGAMIVSDIDEVLVIMEKGKVVRSSVAGVPAKSRNTIGVIFAKPDKDDRIMEIAKNSERNLEPEDLPIGGNDEKLATASENLDKMKSKI